MKKRFVAAAMVAVALTAGAGVVAFAAPSEGASGEAKQKIETVTLPTGDKVRVGDDAVLPRPAEGREGVGFHSMTLRGDRIVTPLDSLGGADYDNRLYNVDALVRHGYSDARKVDDPAALGEDTTAASGGTKVNVKYRWLDGSAPKGAMGGWVNQETGDQGALEFSKGKATVDLEPGRYTLMSDMFEGTSAPQENAKAVKAVSEFKVGDQTESVTVDGAKAKKVKVSVDRDATIKSQQTWSFTQGGDNAPVTSGFGIGGPDAQVYAIPNESSGFNDCTANACMRPDEDTEPPPAGFIHHTDLREGDDTFDLYEEFEKSIPRDLNFRQTVDELAVHKMHYGQLGNAKPKLQRVNRPVTEHFDPPMSAYTAPAKLGDTRNEYFTADSDLTWQLWGGIDSGGIQDEVERNVGSLKPGKQKLNWMNAPLSVNMSTDPSSGLGVRRLPYDADSEEFVARVPMFSSGASNETTLSTGEGKTVLSRDGTEIATGEGPLLTADLPENDKGRYTLDTKLTRDSKWTSLGSSSSATWEFDSAPSDQDVAPSLSYVKFDAEGVGSGYADRAKPQAITLDFETQGGAKARDCEKLTFDVSYDGGKNWEEVDVKREGNHAEASLEHPAEAKTVSVRYKATDDKGQTVEASTIDSYGLK